MDHYVRLASLALPNSLLQQTAFPNRLLHAIKSNFTPVGDSVVLLFNDKTKRLYVTDESKCSVCLLDYTPKEILEVLELATNVMLFDISVLEYIPLRSDYFIDQDFYMVDSDSLHFLSAVFKVMQNTPSLAADSPNFQNIRFFLAEEFDELKEKLNKAFEAKENTSYEAVTVLNNINYYKNKLSFSPETHL